jgi:S-adenosyl-L-methionine hydrolase (adenosine-forming)
MAPIITLTTDFGERDGFVGTMKGVILEICPGARLVDISHAIEPQDIAGASLVLQAAAPYFPEGTIHLVVVDPGVGTERKGVALRTPEATFVGPDNGVLGLVWKDAEARMGVSNIDVVELAQPRFFLPKVSATFHGRDVFAPVAAHLALGARFEELGPVVSTLHPSPVPEPVPLDDGGLAGEVVAIDRFGNCVTNLTLEDLAAIAPPDTLRVELDGRPLGPVRRTFGDTAPGTVLALIGSGARLEIALCNGNLAESSGTGKGSRVVVRSARK